MTRRGMTLDEATHVVRMNPRRPGERGFAYIERLAVLCGYMDQGAGALPADHEWESAGAVVASAAREPYWQR